MITFINIYEAKIQVRDDVACCEAVYERVIDVATSAHRMRSKDYYVRLHFLEALNRKIL